MRKNKYYKENLVVVEYNGFSVNDENGINYLNDQYNNGILKYEDKYKSTVEEVEYDGLMKTKISFTKI